MSKKVEKLKEEIDAIFENSEHQADAIEKIYALAFPNDWDNIKKIDGGWPKAGERLWTYIMDAFRKFDRRVHPDVMAGGAWFNSGFSCDKELNPWGIRTDHLKIEYV